MTGRRCSGKIDNNIIKGGFHVKVYGIRLAILFSFLLLLGGCATNDDGDASLEKQKSNKDNESILFFKESFVDEYNYSIGELFIKTDGAAEQDKIATGVQNDSFYFEESLNKVLFIDEYDTLYEYTIGQDKVKLAEDVADYSFENNHVYLIYQDYNDDLYIIKDESNVEKIASQVSQYELIGNDLYYLNENNKLLIYNVEDRTEIDIANDVYYFVNFDDKGQLAYVNDEYFLFYREGREKENIKISSNTVSPELISLSDKKLVYIGTDSNGDDSLFETTISSQNETKKIADDVLEFGVYKNGYFYLNYDENLYKKDTKAEAPVKIASEVLGFYISENQSVIYTGSGGSLYHVDSKNETKKIADDVSNHILITEKDIVYTNEEGALFYNDKKIAGDIKGFTVSANHLIYSTDDHKLFTYKKGSEAQLLEEDLNSYSSVYYNNTLVYTKMLSFKDVAGIWKTDNDEYIEITQDGLFKDLLYGSSEKLEINHATYKEIYAYGDEDSMTIGLIDENELSIELDDEVLYLSKSTKQEVDEHATATEEAYENEAIDHLFYEYLSSFESAVNYGDIDYISTYMAPDGEFLSQQKKLVEGYYERGIEEEFLDYTVLEIDKKDDKNFDVTVSEEFYIYNRSTNEGKDGQFKNIYRVVKGHDGYYIASVQVGT